MSFRSTRRVEFRDTDAAGIVHFSAFFPMMEAAEHEFLRSLGLSVMPSKADPDAVTWPRVSATCDFRTAARFEDLLTIDLSVEHIGGSSVRCGYRFTRDDDLIAEGSMTTVCCRLTPGGGLTKVDIPPTIREKLRAHLAE